MTRRPPHRLTPLLLAGLLAGPGCTSVRLGPAKAERDPAGVAPPVAPAPSPTTPPGKHAVRVSQYVFHSDFELKAETPLFQELGELREQVYKELHLPTSSSLVNVYLFENRDRYEKFMQARYPDLPNRRAFFIAQPRAVAGGDELLVYTFWGDHIRQDLRHELTHALLHCVLKDVPLWLDEGLAEYFELPPAHQGINPKHVREFREGKVRPDLARLERLGQVAQMRPPEYCESWAWVHFMLHSRPEAKGVLLAYLQQLRTNPNPGPLQARLAAACPGLDEALADHLAGVPDPTAVRR